MDFYQKYLKYKRKYQELKMLGGALTGSIYNKNYAQPPSSDPYSDLHDNKNKVVIASDYYRIKRKEKQCKLLFSYKIGNKKHITHKEYENLINYANLVKIPKETLDYCIKTEKIKVDPQINQVAPANPVPPKLVAPPKPVFANPVPPKPVAPNPVPPKLVSSRQAIPKPIPYGSCSKYINVLLGNNKNITNSEYQKFITDFQKHGINREVFDQCLKDQQITISNSTESNENPVAPPLLGPRPVAPRPIVPPPIAPPPIAPPSSHSQSIKHKPITDDNLEFFFNFNKSRNHILQKYSNLTNLQSPIKRIGTASANGFINKLSFSNSRDNRNLLIAMKTSQRQDADNNYYEFTVGRCINKIKRYLPNFVYTFDFMNVNQQFKSKIMGDYNNVADFKANVTVKKINEGNESQKENIEAGCINNKTSSIWLQWIPNSMSLDQVLRSQAFLNYKNTEVFNILFQVYATLSGLKDIYTHYDLHPGNVSFVPVPEGKTILIVYNINGNQYDINTHFIPVILDYGRSHIDCRKFGSNIDSKNFANVGCSINHCRNPTIPSTCRTNSGLYFNRDERGNYSSPLSQYFIVPANKNISHDLRFLYLFMRETARIQDTRSNTNIYGSFGSVEEKSWFSGQVPAYSYGVPETNSAFGKGFSSKVKNVQDAINWLISIHSKIYLNNPIVNAPKFGRMDIYPEVNKVMREWTFT